MSRTYRTAAQAVVELAIVLPVLMWFALGTLDFGRVFYTYLGLTNAAREGARRATLLAPACDSSVVSAVTSTVRAEQTGLFAAPGPALVISLRDCSTSDRRTVAITGYSFQPVTPFIGQALGDRTGAACLIHTICLGTSATLPVVNQ
jgi:hypothetical protein